MFRRLTAIATLLIAGQTYAQSFIADTIPYTPEAKVADRIRQECTDLGTNLSRKIIEQAKAMVGLAEPADEGNMGGSGAAAQQAPAAPTITDPKAVEALNMAKVWVETRLAKGTRLNEINEAIDVPASQKEFWQSITLSQGAITAIPAGSTAERAVLLLPMQSQGQLIWACAGDIPQAIESICAQ